MCESGDVSGWITAKNHEVCVESLRDAPAARGESESASGVRGERRQDLLITHTSTGHPLELFAGIELVGIADISAE